MVWKVKSPITFVTSLADLHLEFNECSPKHARIAALYSWADEFESVVILADDENTVCQSLRLLGLANVRCVGTLECIHPPQTRPSVKCLLEAGERFVKPGALVMFSNSDLIYRDVGLAIHIAETYFKDYILVGKRLDADFAGTCLSGHGRSVLSGWGSNTNGAILVHDKFQRALLLNATLHDEYGIDYLVYTKGSLPLHRMPDFLIGIWKWDSWMLDNIVRTSDVPLIDSTGTIKAIHLQTTLAEHRNRSGAEYNKDLYIKYYDLKPPVHLLNDPFPVGYGTIDYAPFVIAETNGTILRRWCYSNLPGRSNEDCSSVLPS